MEPFLELRRSDIGFGRVVLDDHGITRTSLFSTQALPWGEIDDYRLTFEMTGGFPELLYFVDWIETALFVLDVVNAARGKSNVRLGIELRGAARSLRFNWRFRDVTRAIAHVLDRIGPRVATNARARLATDRCVGFGDLVISEREVRWGNKPPLLREDVESIELFDSSPVRLRVMQRGAVLPYGQSPTAVVPNVHAALEIASSLGYRVRGGELLTALSLRSRAAGS